MALFLLVLAGNTFSMLALPAKALVVLAALLALYAFLKSVSCQFSREGLREDALKLLLGAVIAIGAGSFFSTEVKLGGFELRSPLYYFYAGATETDEALKKSEVLGAEIREYARGEKALIAMYDGLFMDNSD